MKNTKVSVTGRNGFQEPFSSYAKIIDVKV